MKQEASFFEGKEATLVYIAKRLKEALKLESILSTAGIDYGVEPDKYRGGTLFVRERIGAFFYVLPEAVEATHSIMRANGYRPYEEPQ